MARMLACSCERNTGAAVLDAHEDADAIDLTGAAPALAAGLAPPAAGNLKRVFRGRGRATAPDQESPEKTGA